MLNKKIFLFLCISLIIFILAGCGGGVDPQLSATGSVTVAWATPTTYVDGTTVTGQVGFKVYYGTKSRDYTNYIDVHSATNYTINSLYPGTYYIAIAAYDSLGNESDFSEEISATVI